MDAIDPSPKLDELQSSKASPQSDPRVHRSSDQPDIGLRLQIADKETPSIRISGMGELVKTVEVVRVWSGGPEIQDSAAEDSEPGTRA